MAKLKMQHTELAGAEYIVLCAQVVGNPERGYDIVHNFDGERFTTRKAAIAHGFEIRGSDDFNIGVLQDGVLSSLDWMHETVDNEPDELARIAAQLDLSS